MKTNPKSTEIDRLLFRFEHQRKLGTFRSRIAKKELSALIIGCVPEIRKLHKTGRAVLHNDQYYGSNETVDKVLDNLRKIGIE